MEVFAVADYMEDSTYKATARKLARLSEQVLAWVERFRSRIRLADCRGLAVDETALEGWGSGSIGP